MDDSDPKKKGQKVSKKINNQTKSKLHSSKGTRFTFDVKLTGLDWHHLLDSFGRHQKIFLSNLFFT